jgi:hypothetical protein
MAESQISLQDCSTVEWMPHFAMRQVSVLSHSSLFTLSIVQILYFDLKSILIFIFYQTGAYFIDREGKYFAPILEYLRTGEVHLPKDMPAQFVAREAQYYGIDMPINDIVEKSMMSFVTGQESEHPIFSLLRDRIVNR